VNEEMTARKLRATRTSATFQLIPRMAIEGWAAETSHSFELHEVSGGHFFIHERSDEILTTVAGWLAARALATVREPTGVASAPGLPRKAPWAKEKRASPRRNRLRTAKIGASRPRRSRPSPI